MGTQAASLLVSAASRNKLCLERVQPLLIRRSQTFPALPRDRHVAVVPDKIVEAQKSFAFHRSV